MFYAIYFYMANGYFFDNLKRFFALNKGLLLTILVIFLIGFITGIFCTIKSNVEINLTYLQNIPLKLLLTKKMSTFGFIFCEVGICFVLLFSAFLLSFTKLSKVIFVLIFIFLSYILGIDLSVIVTSWGVVRGIVYAIVCFIFGALNIFLLMIFSFKMSIFNRERCLYGTSVLKGGEGQMMLSFFVFIVGSIIFQGVALFILSKIFVF